METVEVTIYLGDNSRYRARKINHCTNPKMGKRHVNYESMLPTYFIDDLHKFHLEPGKKFIGKVWGETIFLKTELK